MNLVNNPHGTVSRRDTHDPLQIIPPESPKEEESQVSLVNLQPSTRSEDSSAVRSWWLKAPTTLK